jgi:signal transduction histidine kinase
VELRQPKTARPQQPGEVFEKIAPMNRFAGSLGRRHIFTNLLTNAVKYSYAGRAVWFRDQGIGIPEADREWLFNAFQRGHNVDDRPGTGLGLVIVKRCVELHRGKITVESKIGQGTTVTVRLPI